MGREIKVTTAMVQAGAAVLCAPSVASGQISSEDLARRIYIAMATAKTPETHRPCSQIVRDSQSN